jgi:antitoxin ParD1/3/4
MNISLPQSLKEWVEQQISERGYNTASEFVRDVLRREQARARIDARLIEAIESGPATPMTRKDWVAIRRKGLMRVAARKKR